MESGLAFPAGWRRIFLIFREPPSEIVRRNGDGAMGGLGLGGVVIPEKIFRGLALGDGVFGRRTRHIGESR